MYKLIEAFNQHTENYGEEFVNSKICITDAYDRNDKVIYKGKPLEAPQELLEKQLCIISSIGNMTIYKVDNR